MIELSLYVQRRISRSEVEKALEMMVEVEGVHELREKKRRSYGDWGGGLVMKCPKTSNVSIKNLRLYALKYIGPKIITASRKRPE